MIVPSGVTEIASAAFESCANLTGVTITGSVGKLSGNTFHNCKSLKTVILPDGIRLEGNNNFNQCFALRNMVFVGQPGYIYPTAICQPGQGWKTNLSDLIVYVSSTEAATDRLKAALAYNQENTYNIANLNGGEIAELSDSGFAALKEREGLTFQGWFDENGVKVDAPAYDKAVYTAIWEEIKPVYTVTIDGTTYEVKEGSTLADILPEVSDRDDSNFVGWFNDENEVTADTVVTGEMNITAKWEPKTYTVTVDGAEYTVKHGDLLKELLDTITPTTDEEGVHFDKWVDSEGNEIAEDAVITGEMSITAKWAKNKYTVTIDAAGGTIDGEGTITVRHGETMTLPTPTRSGYTFQGWFNGDDQITAETPVTGEMTITARWTRNSSGSSGGSSSRPNPPQIDIPDPDVPLTGAPVTEIFTDVEADKWYTDAVQYVYDKGLMEGTSASTFDLYLDITRGGMITILYRMEGEPSAAPPSSFTDVEAGKWYTAAIAWGESQGIAKGYGDGTFRPNDLLTREQMVSILFRYAQIKGYDVSARADLSRYADAGQISDYAVDAMSWANAAGILNGTSSTTLTPAGHASRAQIAVLFQNFCEYVAKSEQAE